MNPTSINNVTQKIEEGQLMPKGIKSMEPKDKMKFIGLHVQKDLHTKARIALLKSGNSWKQLIHDLLTRYVAEAEKK